MRMRQIDTADVQGYSQEKLDSDMHPRTYNKTIMVLKLMFKCAVEWGYTNDNPARYARRAKVPHKEMQYLITDEIRRLIESCNSDSRMIITTTILTGLRQSEIVALRWKDIELERGIAHIRRSYNPRFGYSSPKTKGSERTVVLSDYLVKSLGVEKDDSGDDELVFNKNGNPLFPWNLGRDILQPALREAGIKKIRWHDLRHTCAALMISQGINVKFISDQLVHTSIRTTLDIYGHLMPEVPREACDKVDAVLFGVPLVYQGRNDKGT